MVRLYTWAPTTAEAVVEGTVTPDLGHAGLEVVEGDGQPRAYASFWPEQDSLIGRITQLWKPRSVRNPESYAQETDPDGPYMQRVADHVDTFEGLDEDKIVDLWQKLRVSAYDFLHWNCASVCKLLLLSAVPSHIHPALQEAGYDPKDVVRLAHEEERTEALKNLAVSPIIHSHPEELRRIAEAYLAAHKSPA